jgi:uncharacterized protein (DUF302 family)
MDASNAAARGLMESAPTVPGVITLPSEMSVQSVADQLEEVARERGLTVFARIDHRANAIEAGLEMQEAQVVLLGSPKAGTPIMSATPLIALELPLRVLVWAGADGRTWVTFNDPDWLGERFSVPPELLDGIRPLRALVDAARGD